MMILMQLETPSSRRAHRASCASKQRRDHRKKKRHFSNYHSCCTKETNKKDQRSSFFSLILFCSKYARFLCEAIRRSRRREKSARCTKIRVGHPKYKTADFFLFYMKENVTLLRGLSGVVYHRASSRCLKRKKVCGFVFIVVVLYITSSVNN